MRTNEKVRGRIERFGRGTPNALCHHRAEAALSPKRHLGDTLAGILRLIRLAFGLVGDFASRWNGGRSAGGLGPAATLSGSL